MDATHLHLTLTHFPIIGTLFGMAILAYGQFSKNNTIIKVSLVIFILMALLTIPVYLTGEEAEETVEHIAGVSEKLIERHEELAENAIVLMVLLGFLSIISFFTLVRKLSFAKTATILTLAISIITFGVFAQVGKLGGEIRHSEIRQDKFDSIEKLEKGKTIEEGTHQNDDDDDDD